jgi:hypothetical protein
MAKAKEVVADDAVAMTVSRAIIDQLPPFEV